MLQELAAALAETIENDSTAMVEQVCQYHLGVARTEPPELPMQTHSASCSDEVSLPCVSRPLHVAIYCSKLPVQGTPPRCIGSSSEGHLS